MGAAAGLCLYPDLYAYDYDGTHVPARTGDVDAPTFRCRVEGPVPIPQAPVGVVWLAGLDLNPLDVNDEDDRAWLEALVWPGEEDKREQLRAAVGIAAAGPPMLATGDLAEDLAPLATQAPRGGTLVVFHSASAFAESVRASGATWIANEAPQRVPGLPATAPAGHPGEFLLCAAAAPLAFTDAHGTAVRWIAQH